MIENELTDPFSGAIPGESLASSKLGSLPTDSPAKVSDPEKALEAIKQGGLTGQGMGEGILKELVPEAHTDYIVAVISEEFGVLFVIFIVFIFLFITYKVINIIFIEKENYTKLVLIGLISILMIQVLIHLGVNTRLLPSTGMTLPFLSYGGSSFVGSSIIAGLILNYTKKLFRDFKQYE